MEIANPTRKMTFTATMSTTISTAVRMWWENHSQDIWILVDIGSLIIDNPGEIFIHTPLWFLNCIFKSGLRPFYSHTDQFNKVNKTKTNWDIWNNRSLCDNYIFGSMLVIFVINLCTVYQRFCGFCTCVGLLDIHCSMEFGCHG